MSIPEATETTPTTPGPPSAPDAPGTPAPGTSTGDATQAKAPTAAEEEAARLEADKQTLAKVRARHADTDPAASKDDAKAKPAGKTSTKQAAAKADAKSNASTGTPGSTPAEKAASAASGAADQARYEQAMTSLLADGLYDREEIESMDPAKVIARGEQVARRQDEQRQLQAKLDELSQTAKPDAAAKAADAKASGTDASTASTASTGEQPQQDLSAIAKPFVKALREQILYGEDDPAGDELETPVNTFIADLTKTLTSQITSQINAELETRIKSVTDQSEQLARSVNAITDEKQRSEIASRFSAIEDDAEWAKVQAKAETLMQAGISPDRVTALRDAAGMLFGYAAGEAAGKQRERVLRLRGQQIDAPETFERDSTGMSGEDLDRVALKELRQGKPVEHVQRRTGVA